MSAYRITEIGFENREAVFFRTTIEMASKYDIAEWFFVGDQEADVILVNSDRAEYTANIPIDKPTRTNTRPILISCSSSGEKCDPFSYTLKKPITYSMIISLLLKLELELAAVAQTSPPLTEQHNKLNKEQKSRISLQKQMFCDTRLKPETHPFSNSHPIDDNQDQSDQLIGIDDDSDYDIYDLLMDSEVDGIQPKATVTSDIDSQQTANDQSKTSKKSLRIKTYNRINSPTRPFLEETRFLGLIRKHAFLGHPTEITHCIHPPVRIYPDQQIFAHKPYHGLSPDLFSARASGFSINELKKTGDRVAPDNWNTQPLWLLFYLATLYGSEGRLKANNSPHDRLSLTSKPDFDIVPSQSDYRTIADFMMTNEAQDLNTIADGSGVNINTVIDFCNACEEIDIIDRIPSSHSETGPSSKISPDQKPKISTSDKYTESNKGLIERFISKLNNT